MLHVLAVTITLSLLVPAVPTAGVMPPDQLRAAGFTPLTPDDSLVEWDLKPGTQTTGTSK